MGLEVIRAACDKLHGLLHGIRRAPELESKILIISIITQEKIVGRPHQQLRVLAAWH